ncbi:hypothetical protein BWQ96_01215 [Gracilariopsis chorda]|uniref:F-box domain-containing protein n=1 Tax=Gracilariopsis chorda TaxID=448386 RepID=A0A2V3J501_9FLOR|nr:hypothetical protein BWQ96_01215 [Gracilariopsis chorda]|eukprot:PXF49077.1 hypothetical protein BWQ96_01215 [Gracilariopsis chorda]
MSRNNPDDAALATPCLHKRALSRMRPSSHSDQPQSPTTSPNPVTTASTTLPHPNTPLPSLPIQVWAHILSYLTSPNHLCSASLTTTHWYNEIISNHFDRVWRTVWDQHATISSNALLKIPWARLPSNWRHQVSASYNLERLSSPQSSARTLYIPPRYQRDGTVLPSDRLHCTPCNVDLEDVLGKALVAHAFASCAFVAFEHGIALVRRRTLSLRNNRQSCPSLYYERNSFVSGISILSLRAMPPNASLLALSGNGTLLCITVNPDKHRAISWRILDSFASENGAVLNVCASADNKYAVVGFLSGIVRVVDIAKGTRKHTLCMREGADIVVASRKWVVGSSSFQPIALSVWRISDGTCVHSFTHESPGWRNIITIAAIEPGNSDDHFIIWNGRDKLSVLDVERGTFLFSTDIKPRFRRQLRSAVEEAEHGAGSAQLGTCKMALSGDKRFAALATSNRVLIVRVASCLGDSTMHKQLDGARRALVAMSTDDRVVVTAEGNAFGRLGVQVSGKASLAESPRLQVWNAETQTLRSEIRLPSAASSLSVCADVITVICGSIGQALVVFAGKL